MTLVHIPVSLGELIDKITILEIKRERLSGPAREHVLEELRLLEAALEGANLAIDADLCQQLRTVNRSLWEIEDAIREQERLGDFGERFIALARSVYRSNDHRAALKRRLNELHGSGLIEQKSYAAY